VDVRVKTFVQEAADRMGFLHAESGSAAPEAVADDLGVYPLLRRLPLNRPGVGIEVSLVLSYMGEEYMISEVVAPTSSRAVLRTKIRQDTAHTG
jgi:hypothetical protein